MKFKQYLCVNMGLDSCSRANAQGCLRLSASPHAAEKSNCDDEGILRPGYICKRYGLR